MSFINRYFSQNLQRFFDDVSELETHLQNNPNDLITEYFISESNSVSETNNSTSYSFRTSEGLISNLSITGSKLVLDDNLISQTVFCQVTNDLKSINDKRGPVLVDFNLSSSKTINIFNDYFSLTTNGVTILKEGYYEVEYNLYMIGNSSRSNFNPFFQSIQ